MADSEVRTYWRDSAACFRKTNEAWGGLSNMASGYPIFLFNRRIRTAEALYQACRFPHMPEVQALILNEKSPMTAKMRSKPYRRDSRPDWDRVRVPIMKWCLRAKLINNWEPFASLLKSTEDRPIVEDSRKDAFWGAIPDKDAPTLTGQNVLGRLLMELRTKIGDEPASLLTLQPLPICEFLLVGGPLPTITRTTSERAARAMPSNDKQDRTGQPAFL